MKTKTVSQRVVMQEQNRTIRSGLQQIQFGAEFLKEWECLDNADLARAAHDMEMLGFKLRHLLWLRSHNEHKNN